MGIVKVPDSVLNERAKPVQKADKTLIKIIEAMKKTLLSTRDPIGVGLAAPQIGKSLRIFITKPWEKSPISVFINSEIVWQSPDKTTGVPQRKNKFEGCLSIPDIWGMVHRAKKIKLRYQLPTTNYQLQTHTRTFSGFLATIIQHEMDHLNGMLFTQRVLEQKEKLYKLVKNKNGEETFKEIKI